MQKVKYKNFNPDKELIIATIAKIAYENNVSLSDKEQLVLHAIKRANSNFNDLSVSEIGEILSEYNDNQLLGFCNNVKGILHELQFIEIENSDDDNVIASIFPDTNHEGTDIMLTDYDTGEIIELQLKATDSSSYVNSWIENHPDGQILVTEEIAEKMDLESSGISNEELTVDTEDFVDKIIESSDEDEFWEYLPYLPTISVAIAGFSLYLRYRKGEINSRVFKHKFIKLTGVKVAKFTIISALMAIPVLNVITGASVLFMALNSYKNLAKRFIS